MTVPVLLLWIVAGVAVMIVFDCLLMSVLWRLKKGRFDTARNDQGSFKMRTDFGAFTIDGAAQVVRVKTAEEEGEMAFGEIECLDFSFRTERAALNEWINGLDLWDLWGRYEDLTQWYQISMVTAEGKVPIFEVGQYLPREPLMGRVFDYQAGLLSRLGLYHDVEERAHEVLRQLQEAFASAGHPITLTPKWVKEKASREAPDS